MTDTCLSEFKHQDENDLFFRSTTFLTFPHAKASVKIDIETEARWHKCAYEGLCDFGNIARIEERYTRDEMVESNSLEPLAYLLGCECFLAVLGPLQSQI